MADDVRLSLLKYVRAVDENVSLGALNPLGAGGPARYAVTAASTVELAAAVSAAISQGIPYVVIGTGATVLFPDTGFPGLVVFNKSEAVAIASDRSQVVVDSGAHLTRLVTLMASRGLGGLTPFFGQHGTVGGALYSDLTVNGQSILSSVRQVTMLMPPTKLASEATIVRQPVAWLRKEDGPRLRQAKSTASPEQPLPIILTAILQLTSNRYDELAGKLGQRAASIEKRNPRLWGPIFEEVSDSTLETMLIRSGASRLRVGAVFPDRRHPNFLMSKGAASAADVRQLVGQMQQHVTDQFGQELRPAIEFLGLW